MEEATKKSLSLYIHWPFCENKCPYCDFNSHVRADIKEKRWEQALLRELSTEANSFPNRRVSSIFFGGGTPSLMAPETVSSLLQAINNYWELEDNVEITLEANPSSIDKLRFKDFHAIGINRLSLGVQAFNDSALEFLGRTHTVQEVIKALELVREIFPKYSFDLIYCRPGQTLRSWSMELEFALNFAKSHLALYQLTIERGTAFFARHRKAEFKMPDADSAAKQYEYTRDILSYAGLTHYEVSNHSKPGEECRHNLTYWRYGDYVGVGPGAHGRISKSGNKWAYRRISNPEKWLEQTEARGDGIQKKTKLTQKQVFQEMVLMGLRLTEGLDLRELNKQSGFAINHWIKPNNLQLLIDKKLLDLEDGKLRATDTGLLCLDAVITKLLTV